MKNKVSKMEESTWKINNYTHDYTHTQVLKGKGWFTLRHKHKHKHKHNECSHLLHKHKEIDIRKRNELQNEAAVGRTTFV